MLEPEVGADAVGEPVGPGRAVGVGTAEPGEPEVARSTETVVCSVAIRTIGSPTWAARVRARWTVAGSSASFAAHGSRLSNSCRTPASARSRSRA